VLVESNSSDTADLTEAETVATGSGALAGNSAELGNAKHVYQHTGALRDVTAGSNKHWDCGGDYLCTAGEGHDGRPASAHPTDSVPCKEKRG
jgi:hypothetical protein